VSVFDQLCECSKRLLNLHRLDTGYHTSREIRLLEENLIGNYTFCELFPMLSGKPI